jgi:hypothetical protein
MNIQLLHEEAPIGNNITVNDGVFSIMLRLSGEVNTKNPYLLFGNSVAVDFNSSGQARDAQSLGRYGFRFGIRPVFAGKFKYNAQKK